MIPMRNLLLFSSLFLAASAAHAQTDAKFLTAVVAEGAEGVWPGFFTGLPPQTALSIE